MRRLLCVLLLCVLPCSGCSDGDGSRWQGTIETLPNGAVRVLNPGTGVWREAEAWRLVPELAIGEVDGPDATTFAQLIALEVGDDGRIYVLDRQLSELRIFDASGAHMGTAGRQGAGPGEYRNANGLLWLAPDTLLVIDQRGNRYSVVDRDGAYMRSVVRSLPFYAWSFRGGYQDGRLYEQYSVGSDADARPALVGTPLSGEPLPLDTVLLPVADAPRIEPFSIRNERGGMVMGVPFAPRPHYRLDGKGGLWHGHSAAYRIVHSRLDGDTVREIVLDATPLPVTDEEIAEWESGEGPKQFRELGGRLDVGRIPRTKPLFEDLFVDDDGLLWVAVNTPAADAAFDIFDPEGRYLGQVHAAGVKREPYVAPVVRNGRLHLIGRDELDVQRVLVFRIERGSVVAPRERRT